MRRRQTWGSVALPRELLYAIDRGFQGILQATDVTSIRVGKLLLKLMASEIIDDLPHVLGVAFHSFEDARDHKRKLDFRGGRILRIRIARKSLCRTHDCIVGLTWLLFDMQQCGKASK